MVRWYIFAVRTILIILRLYEFCSLHEVGSVYLFFCCSAAVLLEQGVYFCSATCPDMKLTFIWWQSLLRVRSESVSVPPFSDVTTVALRDTTTSWNSLALIGYFLCPTPSIFLISTEGRQQFRFKEKFYKIHIDTNNCQQVTRRTQ
jgi:hypothetical protein